MVTFFGGSTEPMTNAPIGCRTWTSNPARRAAFRPTVQGPVAPSIGSEPVADRLVRESRWAVPWSWGGRPRCPEVRLNIGQILTYQGHPEEGLRAIREVPRESQTSMWAANVAWDLLYLGRRDV